MTNPRIPNASMPIHGPNGLPSVPWFQYWQSLAPGNVNNGVASLNNLTGALNLTAGTNITLVASGQTITINAVVPPPITGFVTATGLPAAGQNTIWSGGTSITSGAVTMPVLSPAHPGRYVGIIVSTPNTGVTLSHGAIADESTLTALDASTLTYLSSDFSPTYTGNDTAGKIIITGTSANPTYSGAATAGKGDILYGGNFVSHFTGTGTLDNAFGAVGGPDIGSGTITNGVGVYGFVQSDGGTFTAGTSFLAQSIFNSGTATGTYSAFFDQVDVGTSPTVAWGFRQLAANHPNIYNSTSEFVLYTQHDYLTASTIVGADSNKRLYSLADPLVVAHGGTGDATLTAHGLLVGEGTSPVVSLGAATNGQIPIGSTGADPVLATITAGSNITVTNAAGSITIAAAAGSGAEVLLATSTPSGTGVVTFSSISGSYTAIRVRGFGRGTAAASSVVIQMTLNSDTGTNYKTERVYGVGATANAAENLTAAYNYISDMTAANATASFATSFEVMIVNYSDTNFYKVMQGGSALCTNNATGNFYRFDVGGWWMNTAAVTRIDLTLSSGNWLAGSKVQLYGIS